MFKKASVVIVLTVALTLCVTGCKKQEQAPSVEQVQLSTTEPTQEVIAEQEQPIDAAASDVSGSLTDPRGGIAVTFSTDPFAGRFDYVDTESEGKYNRFIFTTDVAVKGFHYIEIGHNDDPFYLRVERALYQRSEFLPGHPVVVSASVLSRIPQRGISYLDENNTRRYFFLGENTDEYGNVDGVSLSVFHPRQSGSESGGSTSFTDPRDNQTYRTVRIGSLTWMAQNLNFTTDNSWCYEDNASNCEKYGRLYTWDAAMTACPAGWRVPTDDEWTVLTNYASFDGAGAAAGTRLKSDTDWLDEGGIEFSPGTNEFDFSAMSGGYRWSCGRFSHVAWIGRWWSATENAAAYAWYRNMGVDYTGVSRDSSSKSYGYSLRCVQ
ncbi:MAG: fibrobacter succinogenes major paralogous domain-containing protein [Chitinispirillales bacterium]|jgi:uncharacterized protein (TIGR02145 family)|nr:fibrobacter succinogenes major paralogous domain-containing protein [Chitinispirillales bacterium]